MLLFKLYERYSKRKEDKQEGIHTRHGVVIQPVTVLLMLILCAACERPSCRLTYFNPSQTLISLFSCDKSLLPS